MTDADSLAPFDVVGGVSLDAFGGVLHATTVLR